MFCSIFPNIDGHLISLEPFLAQVRGESVAPQMPTPHMPDLPVGWQRQRKKGKKAVACCCSHVEDSWIVESWGEKRGEAGRMGEQEGRVEVGAGRQEGTRRWGEQEEKIRLILACTMKGPEI